ncbi:PEP-CTERM putative exosortase interaction domain-containing protein [Burkholderiales bacterium JOSHI_001]|nr:PEP-CTERM putative exosortase interaction domain-containing protein [Burkholderiales bacterium JOSHI_001]
MACKGIALGLTTLALALHLGAARAEPAQNFVFDTSAPREVLTVDPTGVVDMLQDASAFAFFSDGSSAQASFTVSGDNISRLAVAQTAQFVLGSQSDVTRDVGKPVEWFITNTDRDRTLVGFAIDGRGQGNGHAAFDINFGPSLSAEGTPGSAGGGTLLMDFTGRTFITGSLTTTYSQPLGVAGAAPVGDLFAHVNVALAFTTGPLNGGLPPPTQLSGVFSTMKFRSDIDAVAYVSAVPEPVPTALLLAGLVALAWRRRFS